MVWLNQLFPSRVLGWRSKEAEGLLDSMDNKGIVQQHWEPVVNLLEKLKKQKQKTIYSNEVSEATQRERDGRRAKPRAQSTEQTQGCSFQHCASLKKGWLWRTGMDFKLICHQYHLRLIFNNFTVKSRHRCLACSTKPSGIFVVLEFSRWLGWILPTVADGKGSLTWTESAHPTVALCQAWLLNEIT